MTYSLAQHQIRILDMMQQRPTLGIFAEAGTGKTMIALTHIYDGIIGGTIDNALVICPSSLVPSWHLAIDRMLDFGYDGFDTQLVKEHVTITSYRMVWTKKDRKAVLRDTVDRSWDVIFVDESHRLGDPHSIQTKMILKLARMAPSRYIMTGTPDNTRYTKLYGQIKFLDPDIWKSYREFDRRYILSKDIFHRPVRYDVELLEGLKHDYGTVVRLADCFDMPDSVDIDVPVPLESVKAYKDMRDYNLADYNIKGESAGIGSLKALQVCSGFYIDDDDIAHRVTCGKLDTMTAIIEGTDDKIVIFANYRESVNMICERLDRDHVSYYRFDGTVKEPVWQAFQKDDTRVIVVQYQRGSEGIDLFAACRMIFYESTLQACLLEQSKARIMRKGQTRHCVYHFLYTPGTIEERIMRNVRKGVDVSRNMLDAWAASERDNP